VTTATEAAAASTLPRLNRSLDLGHSAAARLLPERVLQFGEGNFLRAFVDWMLERMNRAGVFNGRAVLIQPIAQGLADAINEQDGLYTVVLRGRQDGQIVDTKELVSAVSRCVDPYRDFEGFLATAGQPDLRFVVSNTTEAGIRTDPGDTLAARPAPSFPGKLTQLLYARFRAFGGDPARGWVMLPCELIERNGDNLRRAVEQTARRWELPELFMQWLNDACVFTSTLVDRIVTGHPQDEVAALEATLGYQDRLLVAAEIFHAWIIESPRPLESELPLREVGLDVVFTSDVGPYRERKVRILNGAHTMTVLAAYLAGMDTVGDCMNDEQFRAFIERGIAEEILPTLKLPAGELESFARSVAERFANPFIKHQLLSIALNSVSKFQVRILGTMLDYHRLRGTLPARLVFALAALMAFYRGKLRGGIWVGNRPAGEYPIKDDPDVLREFERAWALHAEGPVSAALARPIALGILRQEALWGQDLDAALPGLTDTIAIHLEAITSQGIRPALNHLPLP
jgi:tagaturonate reductase